MNSEILQCEQYSGARLVLFFFCLEFFYIFYIMFRFPSVFLFLCFFSLSSTTPARQTVAPSTRRYQSNLIHTDNSSYTYTLGLSLSHAKFNHTCGLCVDFKKWGWWCGLQTCFVCFCIYAFEIKRSVCLVVVVEKT